MDNRDKNRYNNEYDRERGDFHNKERNDLYNSDREVNRNSSGMHDVTRANYKDRDKHRRLHFLDELSDYKVADGDPDVRGWEVVDVSNRRVGRIDNLLVDVQREKVRYLDVDIDQDMLHKDHDPLDNNNASGVHEYRKDGGDVHMIVPIGLARLDRENKRVISDEINRNILESGHTHRRGESISPEHESKVINCIRNCDTNDSSGSVNRSMGAGSLGSTTTRASGFAGGESETTGRMGSSAISGRSGNRDTFGLHNSSDRSGISNSENRENREMRRPESNDDTQLTRESGQDVNRTSDRRDYSTGTTGLHGSNSLTNEGDARTYGDTERIGSSGLDDARRTRDQANRGPLQDDFYNNRYFDDRRFFGRA